MKKIDEPGSTTSKLFFVINLVVVFILLGYFLLGVFSGSDDFAFPDFGVLTYTTASRQFSFTEPNQLFIREVSDGETTILYFYLSEEDLQKDSTCFESRQRYVAVQQLELCQHAVAAMVLQVLTVADNLTLRQQETQETYVYGDSPGIYGEYIDTNQRAWNTRENSCNSDDEVCLIELDIVDDDTIVSVSLSSRFHTVSHTTQYHHQTFWQYMIDALVFDL